MADKINKPKLKRKIHYNKIKKVNSIIIIRKIHDKLKIIKPKRKIYEINKDISIIQIN